MPSRDDSMVGCSSLCICIIRLHLHIGGGARIGPASDWPGVLEVEPVLFVLLLLLLLLVVVVAGVDVDGGVAHSENVRKFNYSDTAHY